MEVRDSVLKSLETARNEKLIGAPLEARVRLAAGDDLFPLLEEYVRELPDLFIVSQVELARSAGGGLSVQVERAAGAKCERCWKYTTDTGSDAAIPPSAPPAPAPWRRRCMDEPSWQLEPGAGYQRRAGWHPVPQCHGAAMPDLRYKAYAAAAAVFALDRLTKWIVETRVSPGGQLPCDPGLLRHRAFQNRGVAFGLLDDSAIRVADRAPGGAFGWWRWSLVGCPAVERRGGSTGARYGASR